MLDTDTALSGSNATIRSTGVALSDEGTLRLYAGGKDDSGVSLLRSWGTRCGLDGSLPFTAKVRVRRTFGPGKRAQTWAPTVYYRNPQGTTAGTLSCTVSLIKNYDEVRTETFTLEATQDDNGISIKSKKLESLAMVDADVIDCVASMTYSGTAFDSVVTPTIDAIVIPYKVQARN